MALRQLILTKELEKFRAERAALDAVTQQLQQRRTTWEAREAAAVAAFGEITEETPEEERAVFDAEAGEIEAERVALEADEAANLARIGEVDGAISTRENELNELNKKTETPKPNTTINSPVEGRQNTYSYTNNDTEKGASPEREDKRMNHKNIIREMVRDNESIRSVFTQIKETRGLTNAAYTIPNELLPMLYQSIDQYSKLTKYMSVSNVRGEATINLMGSVPEAVWTETTGAFNEVSGSVTQISVSGHKVAGVIYIPNPYLEDSEENLAVIVMDLLSQSIGYAKDKAYLYGNGNNMPVGIVTRLAASTQPSWWGAKQGTFTPLNTTHIGKLSAASVTGTALFREMATMLGKVKEVHRNGAPGKFWAMSTETWNELQMELLTTNAAGAIVTSASNIMPLLGGAVETLDFVPSGDIIGGYGSQYKYVSRSGIQLRRSEHVRFVEDQTAFAGVERGDGKPISGEGFAAFNIHGSNVTTSLEFAPDIANAATDDAEA